MNKNQDFKIGYRWHVIKGNARVTRAKHLRLDLNRTILHFGLLILSRNEAVRTQFLVFSFLPLANDSKMQRERHVGSVYENVVLNGPTCMYF